MLKGIIVLIVTTFTFPALASQPGQPLDCSDFVFLESGHVCTPLTTPGCRTPSGGVGPCGAMNNKVVDNEGRIFRLINSGVIDTCGGQTLLRWMVQWSNGDEWQTLAFVDERCVAPGLADKLYGGNHSGGDPSPSLLFDDKNGHMLVSLFDWCGSDGAIPCSYANGDWLARLSGFATTFEILQTYTPTATAVQFRVPYMPEGLRSADHFDTYWGHVSDLPDFTQAQPMQCSYPADHQPQVGEYLTVADTSPMPAPGTGNYVVTAVTNGAQRRYGRKRINGVLSGRNPAMLPECP